MGKLLPMAFAGSRSWSHFPWCMASGQSEGQAHPVLYWLSEHCYFLHESSGSTFAFWSLWRWDFESQVCNTFQYSDYVTSTFACSIETNLLLLVSCNSVWTWRILTNSVEELSAVSENIQFLVCWANVHDAEGVWWLCNCFVFIGPNTSMCNILIDLLVWLLISLMDINFALGFSD